MKIISRIVLWVVAFLAVVAIGAALSPGSLEGQYPSSQFGIFFRGDSATTARAVAPSDPLPAEGRDYAGQPLFYNVTLATDAVTYLSAICSYTVPCEIVMEAATDYHWGPATTTAASVQKNAALIAGGSSGRWSIAPYSADPALFNMGFAGTTATAAEFRVTVVPRTMP